MGSTTDARTHMKVCHDVGVVRVRVRVRARVITSNQFSVNCWKTFS